RDAGVEPRTKLLRLIGIELCGALLHVLARFGEPTIDARLERRRRHRELGLVTLFVRLRRRSAGGGRRLRGRGDVSSGREIERREADENGGKNLRSHGGPFSFSLVLPDRRWRHAEDASLYPSLRRFRR